MWDKITKKTLHTMINPCTQKRHAKNWHFAGYYSEMDWDPTNPTTKIKKKDILLIIILKRTEIRLIQQSKLQKRHFVGNYFQMDWDPINPTNKQCICYYFKSDLEIQQFDKQNEKNRDYVEYYYQIG